MAEPCFASRRIEVTRVIRLGLRGATSVGIKALGELLLRVRSLFVQHVAGHTE
jgi:hypothetical protein